MGKAKAVGSALEHVFSGSKLNELKNMSIDDLKEIKGIGDKKAQHIYDTVQGMGGEGAKVNGKIVHKLNTIKEFLPGTKFIDCKNSVAPLSS